jgi:hypothetical protein
MKVRLRPTSCSCGSVLKHFHSVSPSGFRLIQCPIGTIDQCLHVIDVGREHRDSDAHRHRCHVLLSHNRGLCGPEPDALGGSLRPFQTALHQIDRELFSPIPSDHVGRTHLSPCDPDNPLSTLSPIA